MLEQKFKKSKSIEVVVFCMILAIGLGVSYRLYNGGYVNRAILMIIAATFIVALVVSSAIKIAYQWEIAVVLRLGKFKSLRGPGIFFIIPAVDTVVFWIDTRVISTALKSKNTFSKDAILVNVDAVLFWRVVDPAMAALNVADYKTAIESVSEAALRYVVGRAMLIELLEGREQIAKDLQSTITERVESWGIKIISIEIKNLLIQEEPVESVLMLYDHLQ